MADRVWRAQGAFDQHDTRALRLAFVQGVLVLQETHLVDDAVERKLAKALIRTLRSGGFVGTSSDIDVDQLVALSVSRVTRTAASSDGGTDLGSSRT